MCIRDRFKGNCSAIDIVLGKGVTVRFGLVIIIPGVLVGGTDALPIVNKRGSLNAGDSGLREYLVPLDCTPDGERSRPSVLVKPPAARILDAILRTCPPPSLLFLSLIHI